MAPGTLNGKVASATPLTVDVTRLGPRLRQQQPTGGGFDPNENPVIIGVGATAGGGSTPDAVSAGQAGAVVLGQNASGANTQAVAIGIYTEVLGPYGVAIGPGRNRANVYQRTTANNSAVAIGREASAGASGIAIGYGASTAYNSSTSTVTGATKGVAVGWGATASGFNDTAIGQSATATGGFGTAVGEDATCTGDSGVAVGSNTSVTADSATAVGFAAQATGADSTAIGTGVHATSANTIVIGRSTETVFVPGLFAPEGGIDGQFLPTSDPGVSGLIWNNGGVLTVSP